MRKFVLLVILVSLFSCTSKVQETETQEIDPNTIYPEGVIYGDSIQKSGEVVIDPEVLNSVHN